VTKSGDKSADGSDKRMEWNGMENEISKDGEK